MPLRPYLRILIDPCNLIMLFFFSNLLIHTMTLTNHNTTTLCSLCKHCCSTAVIAILFFQLLCSSSYTAAEYTNNYDGGFTARLIRKHSPKSPLYNHKRNRSLRRLTVPDIPQSALAPDEKSDEHLMKFSLGTPPFDIYAIADTGSNKLWTQCEPCKNCYKTTHGIFDPRKSSSYHKIACSDRKCKQFDELSHCNRNPLDPCTYNQTYVDTSYTVGEVAKEVITLMSTAGKVVVLKDIVIGCGRKYKEANLPGDGILNHMGIIGLGRGPMSFISQISSYVGGRIFSQCLMPMDVDPEIESYINFGSRSKVSGEGVVTTPLVDMESDPESYYVTVKGITIGNEFLPFNSKGALLEKGNTFIDSGTSLSYLPRHLYEHVVKKLADKLDLMLEPFNKSNNTQYPICFNSTTIPKAPNVALHFDGGGKLELTTGVLYKQEEDLVCLGFLDSTDSGHLTDAVLGNKVQGNILIGFDLDRKMVSFKPTNCMEMETGQSPHATEL